ncbi:NAD(P)-binding protein [Daldinia vernicosa]|uniref:NAD(P)-binding protein n=1 Tax=Daldinia vernicosa TaxID=114800 RepID=UPI0020073232|nr:NAD(P)-binding protein [Daldinia vernicosa]KAI0845643.1 NAD(P)-binding protein [Daldinia vernicosa]
MPSSRVALAGATGNIGTPVLEALLSSDFNVTALSRIGGNSSKLKPHPNLTIKEVDFSSVESLTPALVGVQVVVSCVATLAMGDQDPPIDAAAAAGVRRFIPAEFGIDSMNPLCRQLPIVGVSKAKTQQRLREKSRSNPGFTYTAIANGLFLDWCLEEKIILNIPEHTATLYNGGDVKFSASLLSDIAKAVLGVIAHQDETASRVVYIQSALITQNQLIQYVKDKDGKEWNTVVKDTEDLRQESLAALAEGSKGGVEAAALGFSLCGMFNPDYGCDFSSHLDNELLGIKELSESELRKLVESFL